MATLESLLTTTEMIGKKVTYNGDNRSELSSLVGEVVTVSNNGLTAGVKYPDTGFNEWERFADKNGLVWAADWSWEIVDEPKVAAELDLSNPHAKSIEIIDDEVDRLRKRIGELLNARKVLADL